MAKVVGGGGGVLPPELPPPHAESQSDATAITINTNICNFVPFPNP